MAIAGRMARRTRSAFYGWWIVGGGVGIQILLGGLLNQAYGAYVVTLQQQFGWSKTAFSAAYAIQQAESGLLGPFHGWLLDRWGPRNVIRLGLVILGVGFMLFSQVNSLLTFYLAFTVMSIGMSLGGFMSITTALVHWFERRRATALAFMQTGGALGGVMVPLVAWSLTTNGWRATAFASGVLVIVAGLPLAQVMRNRPEQYGLLPDGVVRGAVASDVVDATLDAPVAGFTPREALRTRTFWYLSIGHSLAMFVVASVTVHLVPHLTEDLSFSLAGAAGIVSVMTGSMMVGSLTGGVLGDRYSKRVLSTVATCGHVAAMLVFAYASALGAIAVGAMIQGASHGLRGVQMMPMRADYFGRQSFATIMGISSMVMMPGIIFGPIVVGMLADHYGNYDLGFHILAGVGIVGAVFFALAARPSLPVRGSTP
ncbi:MAG TPA: MFS transporter [Thermomicrobiales bacterium]|nr:MFS transporter [Thermomicrobiales bacterium]